MQPDLELPKGAAFTETPIFEQTAADLGTPGLTGSPAAAGALPRQRQAEAPGNAEYPGNAGYPETEDFPAVGGSTGPVYRFDDYETTWAPAVTDSPGVFSDSAGRRRAWVRLLAVAAAVLLLVIIVVAAMGLLGGPKAPFVPWPTPAARPQHGSAPATHGQQRDRTVSSASSSASHARPRPATARSPVASPAPAATAPASAASSHTPPGMAHRPSGRPSKPQ